MTQHLPSRRALTGSCVLLVAMTVVVALLPLRGARAEVAPSTQLRGVQLHSLWSANTPADVAQQLDLVAGSGSIIARLDVAWSSLMLSARGRSSRPTPSA